MFDGWETENTHFGEEMSDYAEEAEQNDKCKPEGGTDGEVEYMDPNIIRGLTFKKIEHAEDFYFKYSKMLGFDIRRQSMKIRKGSGIVKNREWVCYREGERRPSNRGYFRQRESRPETRCGCKASFRVKHDLVTDLYIVTRFEPNHNHDLETGESARFLRCNRFLASSDKYSLAEMTDAGIGPSKALDYLEHIMGGAGKLSFKRKDGYNYLNKRRLDMIKGGDVNNALSLLDGMKILDKGVVYKHTVDSCGALTRLFWCDSMSKAEFELFGDVMCFDSTYKTNKYRFPLVLFSGINNHYKNCVFGAAVLYDETKESYRWLLRTFRKAMNNKIPSIVLTDQDASMYAAIASEFPGTRHRLCSWHLLRNASQHVKDPAFVRKFGRLLKRKCSIEEFKLSWTQLVEEHNLVSNPWVIDVYEKRQYWAEAYFIGKFLGGMRSTQRSESMNSLVKMSLKPSFTLTQFLNQYNRTVQKMRATFIEKQVDAEKNKPFVEKTPLQKLERHAANVCTKVIFRFVRKQLKAEQGLVAESFTKLSEQNYEFKFSSFTERGVNPVKVEINLDESNFQCDCGMLESYGVPCCHIISGFKCMGISSFPPYSIHPRWLVEVGKDLKNLFAALPIYDSYRSQFGQVQKELVNLCHVSSNTPVGFKVTLNKVKKLAEEIAEDTKNNKKAKENCYTPNHMGTPMEDEGCLNIGKRKFELDIRDPTRIRSRGAGRARQQNCGYCGEPGHKANTCKLNVDKVRRSKKCHGGKSTRSANKSPVGPGMMPPKNGLGISNSTPPTTNIFSSSYDIPSDCYRFASQLHVGTDTFAHIPHASRYDNDGHIFPDLNLSPQKDVELSPQQS